MRKQNHQRILPGHLDYYPLVVLWSNAMSKPEEIWQRMLAFLKQRLVGLPGREFIPISLNLLLLISMLLLRLATP